MIEDASQITVIVNDSDNYTATVTGVDSTSDLAVIRICCDRFRKLAFGNASLLKLGDEIITIGYALGIQGSPTITRGIISAIRYDSDYRSDLIQTDAALNPGNSGGPMLSLDGKIIGINTFRIYQSQSGRQAEGLNFAISATTVQQLIPTLRTASTRPTPHPHPPPNANADSYANANPYANANTNSHCYANTNAYANSPTHAHTHAYTNTHSYANSPPYSHPPDLCQPPDSAKAPRAAMPPPSPSPS